MLLFVSCAVMFHGPPPTKIKREQTPTKDLSPCRQDRSPMPYGEKCLYSYRYAVIPSAEQPTGSPLSSMLFIVSRLLHSACDGKPAPRFKPLTPPSTPVSPCVPTGTALTQTPPPHSHIANQTAAQRPLQQPPSQQTLLVHSHSPPFAVPCAPLSQDAGSFAPEPR